VTSSPTSNAPKSELDTIIACVRLHTELNQSQWQGPSKLPFLAGGGGLQSLYIITRHLDMLIIGIPERTRETGLVY
jgi:hypothetical protein